MSRKSRRESSPKKTPEENLVAALIEVIYDKRKDDGWSKENSRAFLTHCVDTIAKARLYRDSYEEQKKRPYMNVIALHAQVEGACAEAVGLLAFISTSFGDQVRDGVWSLALTTRRIGRKTALHALTPPPDWTRFPSREVSQAEIDAATRMFQEPLS